MLFKRNKKYYGKSDILLAWDYAAEPTWVKGANVPVEEVVKDKEKIKEVEKWYVEFSSEEEVLHGWENEKEINKEVVEDVVKNMKKN